MDAITDYQIGSKIYESANSLILRAVSRSTAQSVIIKVLKTDYPTPSELTRYKQEYEITRSLKIERVIKVYALLPYENTLAIVMEDFGGESLDSWLKHKTLSISEFLTIAIQIVEILEEIHAANLIHKDINPTNIIINPTTGKLKIIDFGIATGFSRENPTIKNPNLLEGTLAYMSPEQTGRMNRALDYSTDFYSLGATFYQLLTQRLPFETDDPLELIHCHIAKQPAPPHEVNPAIPQAVSEIVMKLLAKTAEERYQSAWGIKADLEECLRQLQQAGQIAIFPLAIHDISDRFKISQKLYGREAEIETLLATFQRVIQPELAERKGNGKVHQKQVEMMLVGGYSGIGKSALIQELYKPITQQRGYFIAGKFDQFQRNIPYSAIVLAFQSLIRQLLTESETQLAQWRQKLLAAFGVNGQVMVDVIPELERIVGPQPPVKPLEPIEAQNRFNTVFSNFIQVFCQQSHPLVIFLDDLQWADSASLRLIELMMTDDRTKYLLLLGAYRDNEVSPHHPTILTVDRLQERGAIVNRLILDALKVEEIAQLIADTLHSDRETVQTLAELVAEKTSGNPFFINEFLKTIYQENLLTFDRKQKRWQWDITQIEALGITENVVDLMLGKLRKLPETTQRAMRLAACVGNSFDLSTFSIIYEKSAIETFKDLFSAIQLGLIQPLSDLETTSEAPIESALVIHNYKFLHDRVQQAAYALIDEDRKKAVHLQIGRLLLANLQEEEREETIFTLVAHLNKGRELIESPAEKIQLVELNLRAGKKAKESTAYSAAREYLVVATQEFPGDIWEVRYDLALDLYKQLAEVEYLNGDFEQAHSLIELSLKQAKSVLDRTEFYFIQIGLYTLAGRYSEAIATGRAALKLLGIDLPTDNLQAAFEAEIAEYKENLRGREISSLYDNPEMEIPEKKAALTILTRIAPTAWITNPKLLHVIGTKLVNLNIKYGYALGSPVGYCIFGVICTYVLRDYQAGYQYGDLSVKLCDKYQDVTSKASAAQLHSSVTMPWIKHIKLAEKTNAEGVEAGLQTGELQYTGYTLTYNLYNLIFQGKNLDFLLKEASRCLSFSRETKNLWSINCILAAKILIQNLVGLTPKKLCFDLEETKESHFLETCRKKETLAAICFYYIFKAQVLYLYGKPISLKYLEQSQELLSYIPGTISTAKHNFYYSLTLAASYAQVSAKKQERYWQQLNANQQQMKEWADLCPENFLHKYLLVAAEMARISGQSQEAIDLYDRAIESAREHEFIQNEALANELAAKFWLNRGKEEFAQIYLKKARQCYQIWGAKRKVKDLEGRYPQLLVTLSSRPKSNITVTTSTTSSGEVLDLATVLKASQTISGEIVLSKLLNNLMKTVIESAGAQKGFLILEKEGNWAIEAEGKVNEDDVTILQSIPIDSVEPSTQIPLLSAAIINYVAHTQEDVVLDDAANQGQFTLDPYIVATQSKSVLCIPLLNQGKLNGIVYLENNLTTGAFTPERVEILRVLSAQAAISIENSRLYEQLEDYSRTLEKKVEARTQELQEKNEELAATLQKLKATQAQIIAQEKLASLGALTAGIAHEIKNPLNFVNNFAEMSIELTQELLAEIENQQDRLDSETREYIEELLNDLSQNAQKINEHGKRADNIVRGMLMHSRGQTGERQITDINALLAESVNLAYHGMRAKYSNFNITIETDYDHELDKMHVVPQDISRVFLNIINNACYAVHEKEKERGEGFLPTLSVSTRDLGDREEIRIRDNGKGIPQEVVDKIFNPFFTTKPAGEGTGLGLSISHDIIVQQNLGEIRIETEPGNYTEFIITLPKNLADVQRGKEV